MDKRRVAKALLFGIKNDPAVQKRTTYVRDGSGARAHTLAYADGCITVYQHRDGRVSGWHERSQHGKADEKFDKPEGGRGIYHPDHPEGPAKAQQGGGGSDGGGNVVDGVGKAWDRALRWNGLR